MNRSTLNLLVAAGLCWAVLSGCDKKDPPTLSAAPAATAASTAPAASLPPPNPENNVYFGAVHVHTGWSFDAFTNGSKTTPSDAYAWAQGKPITGSGGPELQLKTPLDFYMVSDHAEFMGVFNQMANPDSPLSKTELAKGVTSPDANVRIQTFAGILRDMSAGKRDPQLTDPALARSVWAQIVKAADDNYVPGKFTTFAGFEWTSNPQQRNLHRVVVFRDTAKLPDLVLSALDSDDPEVLWKWMGDQRAKGSKLFAIPHNGNASDGRMFELVRFDGKPIDAAYNKTRAENEPLYEITQIKGTSETDPSLSPTDEFAGFELWDYTLSADFQRPDPSQGQLRPPGAARRPEPGGRRRRQPVQVRLHRRHRHAQCRGQSRGIQLHRQVRLREQRQGTADRRAWPAGGPDPADPGIQLGRLERRLGPAEHARGDLGCDAAQGNLCHLGPDDEGALLRRLRSCGR